MVLVLLWVAKAHAEPDVPGSAAPATQSADTPQARAPVPTQPAPASTQPARSPDERRPLPDYDGRPPASSGAECLLWVPRIVLAPLYLVSEYVVRRPLGLLISTAERNEWATALFQLFQFGPNNTIAIVPTALIDLGFKPSVGLYARWNDAIVPGNKLRLHVAFWGVDWLRVTLADRVEWDAGKSRVQLRGEYVHRPDGLFFGTGLDNLERNRSRYAFSMLDARLSYEAEFFRASSLQAFTAIRHKDFSADTCCRGPALERRVAANDLLDRDGNPLALPAGYGGYTLSHTRLSLVLDTRHERPAPGSGAAIALDAGYATGIDGNAGSFVRFGAAPRVFWDITGQNRVLSLEVSVQAMRALHGQIPFTELIDLGDVGPLQGFIAGWVIGQSAAAAQLEYQWPIWVWLDGVLHAALGNAFGRDLSGFAVEAMRASAGLGIRTESERDHAFTFTLAAGTAPLRDGFRIDSVRLVFGGTRVF